MSMILRILYRLGFYCVFTNLREINKYT